MTRLRSLDDIRAAGAAAARAHKPLPDAVAGQLAALLAAVDPTPARPTTRAA